MATLKQYNGVYYDKDHDYQADINAAVARGDLKAAGESQIKRIAKINGEGITEYAPSNEYVGYANKSYGGRTYNNATDYGTRADALAAAGNLKGAREAERDANAKILGEGMSYGLRNKYGALDFDGGDSKYSEQLDKLLGMYEDAMNAPAISMPGYSAPSYNPQYDAQIDELLNKLLNRDPFEYNEELDPLYQQYKDMYTKQGQLAMEDTMGQAAALTGGYSSTYSQAVGQQMYNAYLNKVQEMLPEFYDRAYGKYQDEGSNMKDLYGMYIQRDQVDFQRYQQEVANAQAAYQAAAAAASMAYQQQQDQLSNIGNLYGLVSGAEASEYQRYMDKLNQDWAVNQTNYDRNQTAAGLARSEVDAILQAGGVPSAGLISKSGLSPEYINSMKNYYALQTAQTAARSGGRSGGGGGSSRTYPSDKDYKVNKDGSVSVKKVRQLSYQPDEGVFKWNGNQYTSVDSLVDAWSNSSRLTNDDLQVLERKLRSQVSKVQRGGKSGSF